MADIDYQAVIADIEQRIQVLVKARDALRVLSGDWSVPEPQRPTSLHGTVGQRRNAIVAILKQRGPLFPSEIRACPGMAGFHRGTVTNDLRYLEQNGFVVNGVRGWSAVERSDDGASGSPAV